jgi:long-chain acyl-CoA synthetase
MNISQVFEKQAKGAKIALIYYGRKFTYDDLGRFARIFAQVFMRLGVQKGDRVALMMSNVPQFVFAYYGALLAGAMVTPVNLLSLPRSYKATDSTVNVPQELQAQIKDAKPSVIVAFNHFFPLVQCVLGELDGPKPKVVLTAPHEFMSGTLRLFAGQKLRRQGRLIDIQDKPEWLYELPDLLKQEKRHDQPVLFPGMEAREDEVAHLQYTTGTTGVPKGVMLTHANLLTNIAQVNERLAGFLSGEEEVVLGVVPFFHIYGLTVAMHSCLLEQGGALVLVADPQDLRRWVSWVLEYKVTVLLSFPRLFGALRESKFLQGDEFQSVKICVNGAGVLSLNARKSFEKISGAKVLEGYGLSEASPVVSVCTPDDFLEGSIGKPLPNTEVRIIDLESGEDLGPGKEGEIVVRGPQVMRGYWNKPEETAQVLRGGWLYTGDIGYSGEKGFLFITDRMNDMVKIRGEKVFPSKVERTLMQHQSVRDVAVAGIVDEERGERLVACVVRANPETSASDLKAFVSQALADYEVPREFRFLEQSEFDTFKNPLGKILKRKIRESIKKGEL